MHLTFKGTHNSSRKNKLIRVDVDFTSVSSVVKENTCKVTTYINMDDKNKVFPQVMFVTYQRLEF